MMPASGIKVGRLRGIPIYLHSSWFLIFALITFSLAIQFKSQHPQWTEVQHWTLGILTSLLFFASVVFHEMGHSVVALHYRIPVVSITLFIFGGLARISREPASAKQEFNIAIAGPVASYLLAGGFFVLERAAATSAMLFATCQWLAQINFVLATFNLLPGFPLDGGRILRALAWGMTGSFARATRFASRSGQFLAYLMIFFGIWQALSKNWFSGLWLAFIGWFLLTAAQESLAQVMIRNVLRGLHASDLMSQELPTVARNLSLADYVHEVLRTGHRCHLVMDNGSLIGIITLPSLSRFPHQEWSNTSVQAAMLAREKIHWAWPEEPVLNVLERMQQQDINQMPVVEGNRVVGMISRDSILRAIQTHVLVEHLAGQ
jgi:Zn-dependent protease